MASMGERIREARGDMPQDELARALQKVLGHARTISRAAISQWEHDKTRPSPDRLQALSDATGYAYEWLRVERGPKFAQSAENSATSGYDSTAFSRQALGGLTDEVGEVEVTEAELIVLDILRDLPKAVQRNIIRAAIRQLDHAPDKEGAASNPRKQRA